MRATRHFPGIMIAAWALATLAMLSPTTASAQRKCKPSDKPKIEHQVYVPREPGSDEIIRVQLASEYCPGVNADMSWRRWRVLDASGKLLHLANGEILPLSGRHGVIKTGFAQVAVQMFGKKPGPALPWQFPYFNRALYPGMSSDHINAKPVVNLPMMVSVSRPKPGDSTTLRAAIFSGHSYEPHIVEGLGGRAIFGTERFANEYRGASIYNINVADLVMPQQGGLTFQNMTAPDGSAISLMLDLNGEPMGTAIGLVELIRVPERVSNNGHTSPRGQLVSRVASLGAGFPGAWLYTALDHSGQVIPPPDGAVGFTLVRPGVGRDAPIWGVVYQGSAGYEVALSARNDGNLSMMTAPNRYSALSFRPFGQGVESYVLAGKSASSGTWGIVNFNLSAVRTGMPNSFPTLDRAFAAHDEWRRMFAAEATQQQAAYAQQRAAEQQKAAADNHARAVAKFESDYAKRGWGCFDGYYAAIAPLGDSYVKRWYEKCGIPQHLYADARRLSLAQEVFTRSDQMAANARAYDADLRRRGANATAFSNAMAAARSAVGAAEADPWMSIRVTEGGRTTTQVMRQSEYDRRRP